MTKFWRRESIYYETPINPYNISMKIYHIWVRICNVGVIIPHPLPSYYRFMLVEAQCTYNFVPTLPSILHFGTHKKQTWLQCLKFDESIRLLEFDQCTSLMIIIILHVYNRYYLLLLLYIYVSRNKKKMVFLLQSKLAR